MGRPGHPARSREKRPQGCGERVRDPTQATRGLALGHSTTTTLPSDELQAAPSAGFASHRVPILLRYDLADDRWTVLGG